MTVTSMIEKMARAYEPDLWRRIDGDLAGNTTFASAASFAKKSSLKRARAALEAMRDPTKAMRLAANPMNGAHYIVGDFDVVWNAAIDAALAEDK